MKNWLVLIVFCLGISIPMTKGVLAIIPGLLIIALVTYYIYTLNKDLKSEN